MGLFYTYREEDERRKRERDVLFYFFIHIKYRRWDLVKKKKSNMKTVKKKNIYIRSS